jgi:opacity protein-like surface antigen
VGLSWHEDYTYLQASFGVLYRFAERWTADLRYDYMRKTSDVAFYGFDRNRINTGVTYRF